MLDRHDHEQLLAYVEGELSAAESARLQRLMDADPALAEEVEQMRRQRAILQTEPEPSLPYDFTRRIEQMVARPWLIDDDVAGQSSAANRARYAPARPGAFGRRHRRALRWKRLTRFALAACFGLALLGGIATATLLLQPLERIENLLAADAERVPADDEAIGTDPALATHDLTTPPTEDGAIHHFGPNLKPHVLAALDTTTPTTHPAGAPYGERDRVVMKADVMLVIDAADLRRGERAIEQTLRRMTRQQEAIAFVQNFSFDEARQLEEAWLLARAGEIAGEPREAPRADAEGRASGAARANRYRQLERRVLEQLARQGEGRAADRSLSSERLLGSREQAASFLDQLQFSSRGATHTITIPLEMLQPLLVQLDGLADLQYSRLTVLPGDEEPESQAQAENADADDDWVRNWAEARRRIDAMTEAGSNVVIHLPVVIRTHQP